MEKRVVFAMVLSVVFLLAWGKWGPSTPKPRPPVATDTTPGDVAPGDSPPGDVAPGDAAPGGNGDPAQAEPGDDGNPDGPAPAEPQDRPVEYEKVPDVTLQGQRVDWLFTQEGGSLKSAAVYGNPDGPARSAVHGDPGLATDWFEKQGGALGVTLYSALGKGGADLTQRPFELRREGDAVLTRIDAAGLRIEGRFSDGRTDDGEAFHGDYTITVSNPAGKATQSSVTLEVCGPWMPTGTRPPGDDKLLAAARGEDGSVESPETFNPKSVAESLAEKPGYELPPAKWAWIGMRRDSFLFALVPAEPLPGGTTVGFRAAPILSKIRSHSAAPTFRIPLDVPAQGASQSFSFRVFAGPNSHTILRRPVYAELDKAVPTRWLSIGPIEALLSWLLGALASTGLGYGYAIIGLTLIVRGAMFPLSRKSQISMRVHGKRMAVLKPKMEAIKQKYANDARKAQQKTMELMREEKMSMVPGGCLIAFVQMPIWISLYGILQTTFEMRYEGLFWFDDLTAPDHLLKLPFTVPFLGWDWLNLLPLLMMVTWGISAHMQPLPDDPQQRSQAKMMRWMPMMFGLMLYNYASGLALYMTCSAIWSIGETQLIRRVWLSKIDAQFPGVGNTAMAASPM